MTNAEDLLGFERTLLGIRETPDGSNIAHPITDWARQYGYSTGDAWCAWTVSYALWHVDPALVAGMAPTGYSGAFRAWGEKHGRLIPHPQPGAIDVMNFDSDPSFTDHVGVVESVATGQWTCIEGNHLNQVMRVKRSFADGQHWFVMPLYSEPAPEPEEEEMGMMFVPPQKMPKQGDYNVWEFVEGFNQLALYKEAHCWLNLYNESTATIEVKWYLAPSIGEQKVSLGAWQRKSINIGDIARSKGVKDGFTTVVKSKSESLASGVSVFAK